MKTIKRVKEFEDENRRLRKRYAEERIKAEIRKEALEGNLQSYLINVLNYRYCVNSPHYQVNALLRYIVRANRY